MIVERGETAPSSPIEALLTPRQRVVARAAVRGRTARQIAEELSITTETARWTLREIYRRLGVRTRAALATALGSSSSP